MINMEQFKPQFIIDEKGRKESVILSMTNFRELMDDLEDLVLVAERVKEPTSNHADFIKELKNSGIL